MPTAFDGRNLLPDMRQRSFLADADTIDEYLAENGVTVHGSGQPIARWIDTLRQAAASRSAPLPQVRATPTALRKESTALDLVMATRLAWAIGVLRGERRRVDVAKSVFTDEIASQDLPLDDTRRPLMPRGTETIYLAARILKASPNGTVRVGGRKSKGVDVVWNASGCPEIEFERKDRAFRAAYDGRPSSLARHFRTGILEAAKKFEPGEAARVVVIGCMATWKQIPDLRNILLQERAALAGELANYPAGPHVAISYCVGVEITGSASFRTTAGTYSRCGPSGRSGAGSSVSGSCLWAAQYVKRVRHRSRREVTAQVAPRGLHRLVAAVARLVSAYAPDGRTAPGECVARVRLLVQRMLVSRLCSAVDGRVRV